MPFNCDRMPPVNNILYYRVHAEITVIGGGNAGSRLAILFLCAFKNVIVQYKKTI